MRSIWLIARSVLIEAVRRREIYAIVLLTMLFIGAVMMVDFFKIEGLVKFYREVALKVMSVATGITTVVLASRQLPREFETRTIYPLLAKPVGRGSFLIGKLLGVMLTAGFTLAMFMGVFLLGSLYLKSSIPWGLLMQHIVLQMEMLLILSTLCFWLSMMMNLDAAITLGLVFYFTSSIMWQATSFLYDYTKDMPFQRNGLVALAFGLPPLSLYDLSEKIVHAEGWSTIPAWPILALTAWGLMFSTIYAAAGYWCFRRRAL